MDEPEVLSRRARRALPLMAGALAAIVVAGLVYLHPSFPSSTTTLVARAVPSPPVIPGTYAATFDFVTPSNGWAFLNDNLNGPQHVFLFRTTDGARHWQKQFTGSSSQFGIQTGVQFFDRNRGLIAFGFPAQLYRTDDAGNHWAGVTLPPYPVSTITFSDPSHGWVLGQEQPSEQKPEVRVRFFATTSGGGTWTELPWPAWAAFWGGKGVLGGDLQFRRPNDGWLGAAADRPTVYSTTDGGATWQPHVLPNLPPYDPALGGKPIPPGGLGSAYSTHVTLLPGSGVIAFVDYDVRGGAYTSFDGGRSWRALALPPPEVTYSDFVFQDSTHWWAMRFGTLWKSSDAGQTWKHVGQLLDDFDYRPHVIDAKHAWAELHTSTGSRYPVTGLAMSSDAGLHWTYVNVPRPE
jgi:photosystem II stability/assembly factor-like uncharacterized protein